MADRPRFDSKALLEAVDAARKARGLSWSALAEEIGVASSTIRSLAEAGPKEADGVLAMVRWLGAAPERFVVPTAPATAASPITPEDLRRFDAAALFVALDTKRHAIGASWREIAAAIGNASPPMITRLARGGRVDIHLAVAASAWLGAPLSRFATKTTCMSDTAEPMG